MENQNVLEELVKALQTAIKMDTREKIGAPGTQLPYANGMFGCFAPGAIISSMLTDDGLQAWLGWNPSTSAIRVTNILSWMGPQGTEAGRITWNRTNDCGDCPSVEWGKCQLISCFGEICAKSPVLKLTDVGMKAWENQPMYYMQGPNQGIPIRNDEEFLVAVAANVLKQNLNRLLVVGNKTVTPKDFDGLQVLINSPVVDFRTGASCCDADPVIYDWASAAMSSSVCNVITAVVRRIMQRAAPLGGVNARAGDIVLVMTPTMKDALLDFAACGCGPCSTAPTMQNFAPREERARLEAAGLFGDGVFEVDGIPISIVTSSWIPQTQAAPRFCSDIFVLTRRVGNIPVLYGEYQDFASTLQGIDIGMTHGRVTDNGRFLTWRYSQNECYDVSLLTKPRLVLHAPWLQGRITDVCAPFVLPPISANPADDYWVANCASTGLPGNPASYLVEYWYGSC